jgi:hypothetical protein
MSYFDNLQFDPNVQNSHPIHRHQPTITILLHKLLECCSYVKRIYLKNKRY